MPTARKMHRTWHTLWMEVIAKLEEAAHTSDRIREANKGSGMTAYKNRQAAADVTIAVLWAVAELRKVKWEPAKGEGDG